tara:strand:+ start:5027 stop:5209 length:183 start_codon:yes stop_codon:yes gene_type:complete
MDSKNGNLRDENGNRFKLIKLEINKGLGALKIILDNIELIDDDRLYNNKLKESKWLRRLF